MNISLNRDTARQPPDHLKFNTFVTERFKDLRIMHHTGAQSFNQLFPASDDIGWNIKTDWTCGNQSQALAKHLTGLETVSEKVC
ncbi:hypothetical protein A3194_06300 [Candidatus Thiodiazotropha endoloripes]|nr:hypothetical protein A3194_06300 [Candidatus Thiodiazotropha endoloripes]